MVSPFKDMCGDYLGGQVFTCPPELDNAMDLWALGLRDEGGENGYFEMFLMDLLTGGSWKLTQWPKKIKGCPVDPPGTPPNPPSPPPADPDVGYYQHVWHSENLPFEEVPHCNRELQAPSGRLEFAKDFYGFTYTYVTVIFTSDSTGLIWRQTFRTLDWFDDDGVYQSFVSSWIIWVSSAESTPPPLPTGSGWSYTTGRGRFSGRDIHYNFPTIQTDRLKYITAATCTPKPDRSPVVPAPPRDPNVPPQANFAEFSLSLDPQRRPIVRFKHTPQCGKNPEGQTLYEFDAYLRLERDRIETYKGSSSMRDWRFDLPNFRCKDELKRNQYISFESGRAWVWAAEVTIASSSIALNAAPVQIKIVKAKLAESDCTFLTDEAQPRKTLRIIWRDSSGPSSLTKLQLVAFAAISKPR